MSGSLRFARALVVAVLLAPAASVPAQSSDAPVPGDTLIDGTIGDARILIPILAADSASAGVCGLVFNGLVKYAPDLTLTGDLAQRWEVQEEGLVLVFHLRRGVRWHDGRPFTARDVEFTYRKLIDPNVPTPYSGDFERVASLELVDDHTVKVRYKEPFAPGLSSWTMSMMPEHLLGPADWQTTPLARQPIGTGPYRFKRWKTDESIELVASPDYFEHRPHIDRYFFRVIPDQATMFLELSTEQLDTMGLSPLQYHRQTDTPFFRQRYHKFRYPSFGYTYLGYNLVDPLFQDVRVRRALNAAINKQELIDGVLMGLGRVSTGPFPPESWAYNTAIAPEPYDPAKAAALLAEAGWRDANGDGILDRNGRPFAFTMLTNQGNETRQRTAEIVQRRLREIGIQVEIRIIEWSALLAQYIEPKQFQTILLGWSLSRDPDLFDLFHSSKIKRGEFNIGSYRNDEVDRLILEGRRTFDQQRRAAIYRRIHQLIYEDQPYTFLYVPDALPIVHRRFRNVIPSAIGIGYNQIDWYAPKAEQRYTRWALDS